MSQLSVIYIGRIENLKFIFRNLFINMYRLETSAHLINLFSPVLHLQLYMVIVLFVLRLQNSDWNNEPLHVKNSVTISQFKKSLKTYLFPSYNPVSACLIEFFNQNLGIFNVRISVLVNKKKAGSVLNHRLNLLDYHFLSLKEFLCLHICILSAPCTKTQTL